MSGANGVPVPCPECGHARVWVLRKKIPPGALCMTCSAKRASRVAHPVPSRFPMRVHLACPECGVRRGLVANTPGALRGLAQRRCVPCANHSEVDPMVVESILAGHKVKGSSADKREAARVLTEFGFSAREIAVRLGTTDRTITRYRKELREAGAPEQAA